MKAKTSLLLAAALALFSPRHGSFAQDQAEKPLSAYRDKNRVLLVFAPSDKDASYQEQMKLWQPEKAGFEDRQLVVLPVLAEGKLSVSDAPVALEKRFGTDGKSFKVVLVGKDGHEAYSSTRPVTAENLYGRIDAMPMRRDEVKRKKDKK